MSVTEICTTCTSNKPTLPCKASLSFKNLPASSAPHLHAPAVGQPTSPLFLKTLHLSKQTKNFLKNEYSTFSPIKTKTFPKTFLPHYLSPHLPNEKSITIYTFVQALLYVRNRYCII